MGQAASQAQLELWHVPGCNIHVYISFVTSDDYNVFSLFRHQFVM
eukprot:SAG31_NODE_36731_length_310_cov_27.170616_1_plen_44_part_10